MTLVDKVDRERVVHAVLLPRRLCAALERLAFLGLHLLALLVPILAPEPAQALVDRLVHVERVVVLRNRVLCLVPLVARPGVALRRERWPGQEGDVGKQHRRQVRRDARVQHRERADHEPEQQEPQVRRHSVGIVEPVLARSYGCEDGLRSQPSDSPPREAPCETFRGLARSLSYFHRADWCTAGDDSEVNKVGGDG